ncbi:MAG: alpha-L-rhamnosidase-related protein, partial [Planctomycetota bacterium]
DKVGDGHYFVDFGRAGFAHLELAISSPAGGTEFEVRLGERPDGRAVHTRPGGAVHQSSATIALKEGEHTYIPRTRGTGKMPLGLSAVPFRYAEIIGCPVPLDAGMVKQVVHHYAFDEAASRFRSSDDVLNDVWEMCRYTMKATSFCGIYVDGNRQRDPLHGDALINQLGHYCVDREYSMPRYSHEVLVMSRHWSAEWMMCAPLMAWQDYMYTGNEESLRRYYDVLKLKTLHDLAREDGLISARIHPSLVEGWVASKEAGRVAAITDPAERRAALEALTRGEGIRDRRIRSEREKKALAAWARHEFRKLAGDYVNPGPGDPENVIAWSGSRHIIDIIDWPGGERDGYDIVDVNTVPNAMHYGTLVAMGRIARALGKHDDVRFFAERAALVRRSINEKLFDFGPGIYVDGEGSEHASLHANMFPLAFGLVPEERKGRVLEFVRAKGMACSVYGAQYLLEGLYRSRDPAAEQHALDLMRARTQRSWAHMIYDVGSTVAMEAWDIRNKGNLDWNHAWGAAPANIIPRFLMGIRPLEPGFRRVLVEPMPGDLRRAECMTPTIRGPVKVSFEQDPGRSFVLEVTIPANMTARVSVPSLGGDSAAVTLDGESIHGRREGERVTVDGIGSGRHVLERRAP